MAENIKIELIIRKIVSKDKNIERDINYNFNILTQTLKKIVNSINKQNNWVK